MLVRRTYCKTSACGGRMVYIVRMVTHSRDLRKGAAVGQQRYVELVSRQHVSSPGTYFF